MAAIFSGLNIGFCHVMPVLPFLWLLAAAALPWWLKNRLTRTLLLLLLAWYALSTIRQHPHYLATFNRLVGGSEEGYRYLGDSNIDWGQDLNLLAAYAAEQDPEAFHYSYFGVGDPAYYGLAQPSLLSPDRRAEFSPANPAPSRYALSVNHVQGIDAPLDLFDWFRRQEPSGSLGHSILLYEVEEAATGSWIAHCLAPAPLLSPEAAASVLGLDAVRHLQFNCRESWVFPENGAPGWYILPLQAEPWPEERYFPDRLVPVYEHAADASAPDYAVYYWQGAGDLAGEFAALAGEASLPDGTPVTLPGRSVAGDASLLGYRRPAPGTWHTIWQVNGPHSGLSIFAHLYQGEGAPLVADGLGFTGDQWQKQDLFVQYHTFSPDAAPSSPSYFATGLYDFRTGEILPFAAAGQRVPQLHLYPPD